MQEGSQTSQTAATSPAQAAGDSAAAAPASKSGITIISKNGQPVNSNPQATPSPEGDSGDAPPTTNATDTGVNNSATPPSDPPEPGEPSGEPAASSNDDDGQQQPEPDLLALLSDRSQGKITTREQAIALFDEVDQLRTQLAERPEIQFPNEQARRLYEFCQKFPGVEMSAARNFLHVQSLDVTKLDPKDAQFEAFCLKKPHWSREQARSYFEEKYEKAYGSGELETSAMAKMDHDEETRVAREELNKFQQEFAAVQPSQQAGEQQPSELTPDQKAELQRQVEEVTKDFSGVKYQFVPNDANSTVNIQMEKSELQKLQKYLIDPNELLKDLFEECTVNGVFSQQLYRDALFEFKNRKKIHQQLFNQGKVYGEVTLVKDRKNTATPKPTTPAATPTKPATMYDALRMAKKANEKV